MINVQEELYKHQDIAYKQFSSKLMPTINPAIVLGVRMPKLRELAKSMKGQETLFLQTLPHQFYEENNLHGLILSEIADFNCLIPLLNEFLPYVDNWATCDCIRPKCFKKNKDRLFAYICNWLKSNHVYTVRFAIEMLMVYYLDDGFSQKHLSLISAIQSDEYYVNMMIAWYFATALAKQWESVISYLEQNRLPLWVHNKTIQKAIESYRITEEQKSYLRQLRRKNI